MSKQKSVLQIVKEDILELLKKKGNLSFSSIEPEFKVSDSLISEALEKLRKEGLLNSKQGLLFLTPTGVEQAEKIVKKHSILENYFKGMKTKEKAWKAASILEHYISMEVADNIRKLTTLKGKGVALIETEQEQGIITDIIFDDKLFERIVSMGIFPGEKLTVESKLPDSIVIKVGNKKFALAVKIAEKIKIISHE
jgi:Mn-dependent DtxR family transcriptional regulator